MAEAKQAMTAESFEQFIEVLGQLAYQSLRSQRVAILVRREDGAVTVVEPKVFRHIPSVELVASLVDTWADPQLEEFLAFLSKKEAEWDK